MNSPAAQSTIQSPSGGLDRVRLRTRRQGQAGMDEKQKWELPKKFPFLLVQYALRGGAQTAPGLPSMRNMFFL